MPISNTQFYGIGKGGANIIDNSGIDNQFQNILAKQQLQRQQELKQLTDQQAVLKPDGLRNDADRKDFFNQAQDWKQKAIAATNERDPYKKSLLKSQADQAYMQAQDLVNRSKQQGVKDNQFQQFAMNNATRHQLTDDAVTKGLANANIGVNHPDIINDYSTLQRAPDLAGFDKRVKELNDTRLNNTQENYKLGALTNIGNTKQTPITKYKQADAQAQALDYLNEATVNPSFAHVLEQKYPQIYQGAQTEDQYHQAHAMAATQLAKDNVLYKDMGTTFTKNDAPDNFYAHHMFSVNHPIANPNGTQLLPTQAIGASMMNGDANIANQFLNYAPQTQFRKGEKPTFSVQNGYHVINIPDQVTIDQKAVKANEDAKKDYESAPEKKGKRLGLFGGTPVPYEQSDDFKENPPQNEYKVVKQGGTKTLDPRNPIDYNAQVSEIARDLKIPVDQINKQVGGKGSRGVNSAIQQKLNSNPPKISKTNPLGLNL